MLGIIINLFCLFFGQTFKTLLFEMPIQGEGGFNSQTPHGFETYTINKAELLLFAVSMIPTAVWWAA